jgi:hypothetical protein
MSSSLARTIGSSWKRARIAPALSTLAIETTTIPWWCAMYIRTTATVVAGGRRDAV